MLVPAALYKKQIEEAFAARFYSKEMFLITGCLDNWVPNIAENPDASTCQFVMVSYKGDLLGYLAYSVDWYVSRAYNFGVMSFSPGNPVVGADLFHELERLVSQLHRVEWRMVGGNPVEKSYDTFCEKHGGKKFVLKDAIKDSVGKYHDDVIYEIVSENH